MKIKRTQETEMRDTMNEFVMMMAIGLIVTAMILILSYMQPIVALITMGISIVVCTIIANFDIEL